MRKMFLFIAAVFCAAGMSSAQGPTITPNDDLNPDGYWAYYHNNTYEDNDVWDIDGLQWGIMIPGGTMEERFLTKVDIYVNSEHHEDVTVSIYQGGTTPADATLLHTQEASLTANDRVQEIILAPSVEIDPSQDLWIVYSCNWQVATYSLLENGSSPNARWFSSSDHTWSDLAIFGDYYEKVAWMISGLFQDQPLPTAVNIQGSDISSNSANLTWEGDGTYELRYKKHSTQISNSFQEGIGDWTTINADRDRYNFNWEFASLPDAGSCMSSKSYDPTWWCLYPDNYLVSPRLVIGDSVTFMVQGYREHFGIAVSTTSNTDPEAFTIVMEETLGSDAQQTWKKYTVDLSAYKGQKGYVAIRHFNVSCENMLLLKDVQFYPIHPLEPEPEWTVVSNLNEAAYALSDLEPDQEYWVEVRSSDNGKTSDWSKTFKFYTLEAETGIESIVESRESRVESRKILHEGNLYILRDDHIFNAQGARIK